MREAYEGQSDGAYRGEMSDGRKLFIFSQSQLKQVDTCDERGRLTLLGEMPRHSTDSTALGRAVHTAIETSVQDEIDGNGYWHLDDMYELAIEEFDSEMAEPDAEWVKDKTPETVHRKIARCLGAWRNHVRPTLEPLAVEVNFGPLTIHEDEQRVIQLRGQIDYIDAVTGLADWKTAGREWIEWEHKRWDVQPTVYTWADLAIHGALNIGVVSHAWTWHVLQTNGEYQKITTTRGPDDWAWLRERCRVLAIMLEAELPAWSKTDNSALCSPKFCGAWEQCRGPFFGEALPR